MFGLSAGFRRFGAVCACIGLVLAAVAVGVGVSAVSAQQRDLPGSSGPPAEARKQAVALAQRKAAFRSSERGRAERKASRKAAKRPSRGGALKLLGEQHPRVRKAPLWAPLGSGKLAGPVEYLGQRSAKVTTKGGRKGLALSVLPLRQKNRNGDVAPVGLGLEAVAGGWRTKNALADLKIPAKASGRIGVEDIGLRLGPEAGGGTGQVSGGKVFYSGESVDTLLMPIPGGLETFHQIRTVDALKDPIRLGFELPGRGAHPSQGQVLREGGRRRQGAGADQRADRR